MQTRDGEKITVVVLDGRNSKELDENIFNMIIGTGENTPKIIKKALIELDYGTVYLLGICILKHLLKKDYSEEKMKMINKKIGFEAKEVKIIYLDREVKISLEKDLFLQILYQIGSIFVKNSYMLNKKEVKDKIVVDVGANLGIFSVMAAMSGAKKVYAFEPIPESLAILKKTVAKNHLENVILPIETAIGNVEGSINIKYDGRGDQTATIALDDNKKNLRKIRITMLDTILKTEEVSFIKIDTEGYETEVLLGAKNIIKKYKPILSFSAYHKPEDKEKLPQILKNIRNDYRIILVNYGEDNFFCE